MGFIGIFKRKSLIFIIILLIVLYLNLISRLFERDFYSEFDYPLVGNVELYANELRHGKPSIAPINNYSYTFKINSKEKCQRNGGFIKPRIVYIVKSAMPHFERRAAIRNTWGYENRFSDVIIRTVFIVGTSTNDHNLQTDIVNEYNKYKDIVQADFIDTYYNNTIKTVLGYKWAIMYCPYSQFYIFMDDDMYASTKNLLSFVRNPVYYPEYLKRTDETLRMLVRQQRSLVSLNNSLETRFKRQLVDYELPAEAKLYAGFVYDTHPLRDFGSKWYISLKEYPWNKYPRYVTAGSVVLSNEALHVLYYTTFYIKHFRFDDIFIAIAAYKSGIEPLHNGEFMVKYRYFTGINRYALTAHGFEDPDKLVTTWTDARAAGNA